MTNPDRTSPDRRPAFLAAYRHAADIVAGVDPSLLGRPTPCPDYDVATLVSHLVGAGHRAAALGRDEPSPSGEEFPQVELSDAPGELRSAGKEAAAAWSDDARLQASVVMPWGEVYSGATVVDMYLSELATHTWDLALATGQLERLDRDLAGTALEGATAMMKPEYRDLIAPGSPFGPEVPAPEGATSWERLAAFMGRSPAPSGRSLLSQPRG